MIKSSYKGFAENLLLVLNVFIIFLLLFGDRIAIPVWLQPMGRMHPLIIHFPIVILLIFAAMEFFRFPPKIKNDPLYQELTNLSLLAGALLAGFTAIMGLFLSKEPGYDGDIVLWHKWFGVSVVFISSAIYVLRNKGWYNVPIARTAALTGVVCLTVAGHYGADITHGENFVLAPVWRPEKSLVAIDKALVFRDVIEPVFQSKCNSCHNPDKTKGGVMLIDEKSILKGGKDGKIIVPGQPQLSLLLQRIHMPEGEKKHMPPSGKPQLTTDEMNLLYQWIRENQDFNKKVIDLPQNDSLRIVAATFLKPAGETEEQFDFAAADEKLVKKLNNNYRVISPVAQGSPALAVDIYNAASYQPKVLQELSQVKKQVVSLDLDKMPVKDNELKTIAQFENLRTLNLNFTDITGKTLNQLAGLKYLRTLSMAGAGLNPASLTQLNTIKSLKKVALWDTGLTDGEIATLQKSNPHIDFIKSFKDDGKPIKLNVPQVKNTSFVFNKPMPLLLSHPIKGVDIRYTTDGNDPDSIKSAIYKPGINISANTVIKAKAYKAGWLGSDMVQFNFYKSLYTPDSISFITPPDQKYTGDGPKTLVDKDLGGTSFGNGKWIASQKDLAIYMQFNQPVKLHTVTLDCMRNIGSQIFLPVSIEVWGGSDAAHMKLLGTVKTPYPQKNDQFLLKGMDCAVTTGKSLSCLKIVAKALQTLPSWDPVKKQPGWVFVDEIFLN
jgi:uncharacterized membrane protein